MIWNKLKIQSRIVIVTKRVYQTKGVEGESLPSEGKKITSRVVPVATGRAFKERERKQELNKKPCLIQLRALIAREKAKHQAKVDEYNALRAQGFWRDPVRDSNLVSVLEIILEVHEDDERILAEQNAVKSTQTELSFLHIKTRHSFHLVDPSPWPITASLGVFMLTAGSVLYMQKFIGGGLLVITGLALILFVMFTWWRDIIREATFEEQHTFAVQRGLRLGMVLFIVSEIMFFFAFFWAFFHSSLSPTYNIGGVWPPLCIEPIKTLGVPLTNTFFLLTSGATVTWAHHAVVARAKKHSLVALILTLILALLFTCLQVFEYYDSPFAIIDGIFGSSFSKRSIGLDTPSFWQTGFRDPANYWLASEHMHFFLCSSVIFSIWLVVCSVHFFMELNKPRSNKSVLSKEFTKVCFVWVTAFIIAVSLIFHVELWGIPITCLEEESALPEPEVGKEVNPLRGSPEAANQELLEEVWWLLRDFESRGYSKDQILSILQANTKEEFWSLNYDQKSFCVQWFLDTRAQKAKDFSVKVVVAVAVTTIIIAAAWLYSR